ncbi:hypothetical protein J2Z69_001671 [Paenibacillus shirakamiensis]|uniref:Uncharacterized protein n=1 Tax=Paenibacillus shirakamiensis TaxID=1265935 RepID=A0ABS4JFZ6_9BACL|nr:hypothetical protein [Paenibacillus shirakamiensis]MBP2000640.1 hypothetical protein [Paenibacillus shirakamiensis]
MSLKVHEIGAYYPYPSFRPQTVTQTKKDEVDKNRSFRDILQEKIQTSSTRTR